MANRHFIIAAGGTGGHLFPAQALMEHMIEQGESPLLVHDSRARKFFNGTLNDVPKKQLLDFKDGFIIFRVFYLLINILIVLFTMLKNRPLAVISFGGYTAFPTLTAAYLLRVPIILHESNAVLGKVNRWFLPMAQSLAISIPNTLGVKYNDKVQYIGIPVRKELKIQKEVNNSDYKTILVIGGSQGASFISTIIPEALKQLPTKVQAGLQIYQQVREELLINTTKSYQGFAGKFILSAFFDDMAQLYQQSDLVIARSGASTIAELSYFQKPAILIPLPSAMDNHQHYNALFLAVQKGAILLPQAECSKEILADRIAGILNADADVNYLDITDKSTEKLFELCVKNFKKYTL